MCGSLRILSLLLVGVVLAGAGGAPLMRPAEGELRQWFIELADADAAVREAAQDRLMGLSREDLPALRRVVAELRPLAPSQHAVLKEIVAHVYLAGDVYENVRGGFLGIELSVQEVGGQLRVVVDRSIPGFCAYRWLRPGDAVLEIREKPLPQPLGQAEFRAAILELGAGATVHLKVLRRGKEMWVPVTLDARPAGGDLHTMAQMLERRDAEVDAYWRGNFASLLDTQEESGDNGRKRRSSLKDEE